MITLIYQRFLTFLEISKRSKNLNDKEVMNFKTENLLFIRENIPRRRKRCIRKF